MALAGRRDLAAAYAGLRRRSVCFDLTDDLFDDARDRRGGVDYNAVLRDVFFRLTQCHNELPLGWFCAPLIFKAHAQPRWDARLLGTAVDHAEQVAVGVSQNYEVCTFGIVPIDSCGTER